MVFILSGVQIIMYGLVHKYLCKRHLSHFTCLATVKIVLEKKTIDFVLQTSSITRLSNSVDYMVGERGGSFSLSSPSNYADGVTAIRDLKEFLELNF